MEDRIKNIIAKLNLKNETFAAMIGVTPGYVSQWKSGKTIPNDKINKILEVFPNLNKDYLLYGNGEILVEHKTSKVNNDLFNENNLNVVEKIVEKETPITENHQTKKEINKNKTIEKIICIYSDKTFDVYFNN